MALLTHLMLTAWDMWQHHNKALHELEANWQEILEEEVNRQISQVYAQGMGQLPTDAKHLLKWLLNKLLKLPALYQNQWIASVDAAWAQYIQQREGPYNSQWRFMTEYLCQMAHLQ